MLNGVKHLLSTARRLLDWHQILYLRIQNDK